MVLTKSTATRQPDPSTFSPYIKFDEGSTSDVSKGYFKFSQDNQFSILSMGTGHGKTAISIHTAGMYANQLECTPDDPLNVVVIAPRTKVDEEAWDRTFEQYYHHGEYGKIIQHTYSTTFDQLSVYAKNDKTHNKEYQFQAKQKNKKILKQMMKEAKEKGEALSKEQAIKRLKKTSDYVKWQDLRDEKISLKRDVIPLFQNKKTLLIIDEVHNYKNPTTQRGKHLVKLLPFTKTLGATATPMANGIVKDGMGYLVYNEYYTSKTDCMDAHVPYHFRDRYYQPDVYLPDGRIDDRRFQQLDVYKKRLDETIFMPDVPMDFELPDTTTVTRPYQLDDSTSAKIKGHVSDYNKRKYENYMQFLSDVRQCIAQDVEHLREMIRILMHHQKTKTGLVQPLIFYTTNAELGDDPKQLYLDKVANLNQKLTKQEQKKVYQDILSNMENKGILWALAKMKYDYAIVNGQHSIKDVDVSNKNQAIVLQYRAGSAGIEFKQSNVTIFYGLNYSWQDTEQAMGRNVRRGQSHHVNHYFIVSNSPHDTIVWNSLENKREFSEEAMEEFANQLVVEYQD